MPSFLKSLFKRVLPALLLAGCTPTQAQVTASPTATLTLPAPLVTLLACHSCEHVTVTPESFQPTVTPFPETLEEIAQAAYGQRLLEWVRIPVIDGFAPVSPGGWTLEDLYHSEGAAWDSPQAAVGWMVSSALPGDERGTIILYGHNNIEASVFKRLYQLQPGDGIELETGEQVWSFTVEEVEIIPVEGGGDGSLLSAYVNMEEPLKLGVISCYPPDNNTHRVNVTASLADREQ